MKYYKNLDLGPIHYYCEVEQDFKIEEFRAVKDYEGYYEVSDLGRVKSLERRINCPLNGSRVYPPKILKQAVNFGGYLSVHLSKECKVKRYLTHVLEAIAFLGHDPNNTKLEVNHINIIRDCNVLSNLELTTHRTNSNQKHLKSSSRFTGVSWDTARGKWKAGLLAKGKHKFLGRFDIEEEARDAYDNYVKDNNLC